QEGNMHGGRLHEALDDQHGLLEFLRELLVLLVAPGVAQGNKLAVQDRQAALQFVIELLEVMGKAAELLRIDDGMRHEQSFRQERKSARRPSTSISLAAFAGLVIDGVGEGLQRGEGGWVGGVVKYKRM